MARVNNLPVRAHLQVAIESEEGDAINFHPKKSPISSALATVKFQLQVKFLTLQLSPPSGPLSATDG